jgi:hypothetical protein
MAYGQADDARQMNANLHKLDDALTIAREALTKIDAAPDLAAAKDISMRARAKIAEDLAK